jgi:hypothetical protein
MCQLCEILEVAKSEPEQALTMLMALNLALDVAEMSDPETSIEGMMQTAEIKRRIVKVAQVLAIQLGVTMASDATIH